jgi:cytochrome o ubiquinol oxidase subunit 1
MPKNTGAGAVLAGFAFVFGFAVVWHIWWLAIVSGVVMAVVVIVRASDDESEYVLPASEVEKIEQQRYEALARAPRHAAYADASLAPQPLPGGAT